MIVNNDDNDAEMVNDPFLEAGIDIPKELPYPPKTIQSGLNFRRKKDFDLVEMGPQH